MADLPTFQFNPQTTVGGSGGNGAQAPQVGFQGGQSTSGSVQVFDSSPKDIGPSTLPGFLEDAFAPKIAAAKQSAMWAGFTAARSGQSMQDIHEQQPWYSKIFGPTNFEMGADVFSVQKASADVETQFNQNMGDLRKLTPDQIGSHLNDMSQQAMTGDQFTDALIQKSLMDRAGPMMDAHAKARYQWQQQTMSSDQNSAWVSASSAFQSSASAMAQQGRTDPAQAPTPEQIAESKRTFLQTFQSPQGQDPASYLSNVISTTKQLADKGDWYSINALQESGLLNQLAPEAQQQIDAHMETARNKFKSRIASGPLMQPIAQLFTQAKAGAISAKDAVTGMEGINDQYSAMTGDDRPFFDQSDTVHVAESAGGAALSMWQRMWDKNDRQSEKVTDQAAKEAAEARTDSQLTQMAATNSAGDAIGLKGVQRDDVERSFNGLVDSAIASGNPDHAAQVVVGNFSAPMPFVSERLTQRLQSQVGLTAGEQYTNGFENAYQTWHALRYAQVNTGTATDSTSGQAAAIKYYGKYSEPMQNYDDMLSQGMPKELAYRSAFGNAADFGDRAVKGINPKDTTDAQGQLQSAISSATPSWWNPFSGTSPGDSAQSLISAAATGSFMQLKRNNPGLSNADAAQQAVKMAQSNGLEIAGRYAWQNMKGQQPLSLAAGMAPDVFNKLFSQSVDNRFRAQGISIGAGTSIVPIRLSDDSNGPRVVITAYHEGDIKSITLTGKDLKDLRSTQATEQMLDTSSMRRYNVQRHYSPMMTARGT